MPFTNFLLWKIRSLAGFTCLLPPTSPHCPVVIKDNLDSEVWFVINICDVSSLNFFMFTWNFTAVDKKKQCSNSFCAYWLTFYTTTSSFLWSLFELISCLTGEFLSFFSWSECWQPIFWEFAYEKRTFCCQSTWPIIWLSTGFFIANITPQKNYYSIFFPRYLAMED